MSSPLSSSSQSRSLTANQRAAAVRPDAPLALIVAGMHRSGTSAVARALSLCGLGLPHTLMPKNEFNETGYWESEAIKQCNDALLHTLGSSWDDVLASRPARAGRYGKSAVELIKATLQREFDAGSDIVIKDPRISVLFEPWRDALTEAGYAARLVINIRNPLEVAASLAKRDSFPTAKSLLLWLSHLIAIERDSRDVRRVFVSYERMLSDWRSNFHRLESALDVRLPGWNESAELEIDRYLTSEQKHHTVDAALLTRRPDVPEWIAPAYQWAMAASSTDASAIDAPTLDEIATRFHAAANVFAPLLSRQHSSPPLAGAPVQREFNLCLYGATADHPFSEDTCVRGAVLLSDAPQKFALRMSLAGPITALRLDPADQQGRYLLHALRILSPSGEPLWTWDGQPETVAGPGLDVSGLGQSGTLLRFLNEDPQFGLPVVDLLSDSNQIVVEVTASAPSHAALEEAISGVRLTAIEHELTRLAQAAEEAQALSLQVASQNSDSAVFVERRVSALKDDLSAQMRVADHRRDRQIEAQTAKIQASSTQVETLGAQLETRFGVQLSSIEAQFEKLQDNSDRSQASHAERLSVQAQAIDAMSQNLQALARQIEGVSQASGTAEAKHSGQLAGLQHHLNAKLDNIEAHLNARNAFAWRQEQTLKERELAIAVRDEEIKAFKRSTSWRLTAPLRAAKAAPRMTLDFARKAARKIRATLRGRSYAPAAPAIDEHNAQVLLNSPLFDATWYLANNPDVRSAGIDPLAHYLAHGGYEGRAPSISFDSRWYLAQNPDVAIAGINPLLHYLTAGEREGRAPKPAGERPYSTSGQGSGVHEEAVQRMLATASTRGADYETLPPPADISSRIRAIAFYLPQFHPIPENDAWWGKGFTEWTNVSKAVPQFAGHYQPRLPDELGFYDLRLTDIQRRQAELAKQFGVHGFCFHYYWFTGRKRLLERPLNQYVQAKDIDFPFCICWANENWTRRWDGMDQDILMEQRHAPEDDLEFIEDLAPLLRDKRYIHIDGRPLIIVYRVDILPNPKRTAQVWREYCRTHGLADPYLVAAQTFGTTDPRPYGFDAAVEFPPHKIATADISKSQEFINARFDGKIYSYEDVALTESKVEWPNYTLFKTVMPSWDNEARKPGKGHVFTGSTAAIYKNWLSAVSRATDSHFDDADQKLVFINAWNEWAEGAYLEPDRRFGYAYLRATADALSLFPKAQTATSPGALALPPLHVIVHAYYPEIFGELLQRLKDSPVPIGLHVTCPSERSAEVRDTFARSGIQAPFDLIIVENRGRDVLAFIRALAESAIPDDAIVLKIHTKATSHRIDGNEWRDEIMDGLLQPETIRAALTAFSKDEHLGLVAPSGHITPLRTYIGENQPHLDALLRRGNWPPIREDDVFAAGTMFFARRDSLQPLLDLNLSADLFESEDRQRDGTLAHAIERLIAMIIIRNGESITDTGALRSGQPWTANEFFHYAVKTDYLFKRPD